MRNHFVLSKTLSRNKTQFENNYVPPKTFNRYHLPQETNSVPLKTFNRYQVPGKTCFVPPKTFSQDKTRTNCRPHLPTHQDNHTGNRPPSTTTSLPSATRPCTLIRQTKRQRNSYTAMYTHPPDQTTTERLHRHGHRSAYNRNPEVYSCRFPRLSLMRRPEQIQDHLHRIERIQRNLDKTRIPVTHRTIP